MSASLLRDTAARAIQAESDIRTQHLVDARDTTFHALGVKQGVIQGLQLASSLLAQAYQDLHK